MVHFRHCFYCGEPLSRRRATKDHVVPRSRGGSDSHQNIVNACRVCNSEKGRLLLNEYRQVVAFRLKKDPLTFRFPGEWRVEAESHTLTRPKNKRPERKAAGMQLGVCAQCGVAPTCEGQVHCELCMVVCRKQHQETKIKCFDHYGRTCECCGVEFDERFLTLEGVHPSEPENDLYWWVVQNRFPASLQTICWNCNMGKRINGGLCPHKESCETVAKL